MVQPLPGTGSGFWKHRDGGQWDERTMTVFRRDEWPETSNLFSKITEVYGYDELKPEDVIESRNSAVACVSQILDHFNGTIWCFSSGMEPF